MNTEYLRRNLQVAKAEGAHANSKAALKRLQSMKRPPKWLLVALEGIRDRTEGLSADLAAWRNQADDAPDYVARPRPRTATQPQPLKE